MNEFDLVLQTPVVGIDIVHLEFQEGSLFAPACALPSFHNATVSMLPIASMAAGVMISANTGASHSADRPVTILECAPAGEQF